MELRWGFYPSAGHPSVDAAGRVKNERNVGRTTRMGIEQYQDYTLYINDDRNGLKGRRLTDEQLCADWQYEFPDAVQFTAFHVTGVRREFIAGKTRGDQGSNSEHGIRDSAGSVIAGANSHRHG